MIAEFSIVPMTGDTSLSRHVARVVDMVRASGLDWQLTPMGTIVEGEPAAVFDLIRRCHMEMRSVADRVLTRISIDDRGDELGRMNRKVDAVVEKLNDRQLD